MEAIELTKTHKKGTVMQEDPLNKAALEYLSIMSKHMDKDMSLRIQKKMRNLSDILCGSSEVDVRRLAGVASSEVRKAAWQQLCEDAHYIGDQVLLFLPIFVSWAHTPHEVKCVWKNSKSLSSILSGALGAQVFVARFMIPDSTLVDLHPMDFKNIAENHCIRDRCEPDFSFESEKNLVQSYFLPVVLPADKEDQLHALINERKASVDSLLSDMALRLFTKNAEDDVSLFLSAANVAPDVIEEGLFDKDTLNIKSCMDVFQEAPSHHPEINFSELFIRVILVWPTDNLEASFPFMSLKIKWTNEEGQTVMKARYTLKYRTERWTDILGFILAEASSRSWNHVGIEQMTDINVGQERLFDMATSSIH